MDEKILKAILAKLNQRWPEIKADDIQVVFKYLKKFRYLTKAGNLTEDDIQEAVARFQGFFGLEADGVVGPKTVGAAGWPRCGVPEHFAEAASERLNRWGSHKLNYFIQSRDSDLSKDVWDGTIRSAFDNISNVCDLTFTQVDSLAKAQFVLGVGRGSRYDFDGPSGTLAWYELPGSTSHSSQLHGMFDADETWTVGGRGIKLLNVATHELLHGCGLTHSSVKTALMAPFYDPNVYLPQQNDDILRLQARYGKPVNTVPTPIPVPVPTPTPTPVPGGNLNIEIQGTITGINIPGYVVYKR